MLNHINFETVDWRESHICRIYNRNDNGPAEKFKGKSKKPPTSAMKTRSQAKPKPAPKPAKSKPHPAILKKWQDHMKIQSHQQRSSNLMRQKLNNWKPNSITNLMSVANSTTWRFGKETVQWTGANDEADEGNGHTSFPRTSKASCTRNSKASPTTIKISSSTVHWRWVWLWAQRRIPSLPHSIQKHQQPIVHLNCWNCREQIPPRFLFCPWCGEQQ